MDVLSVLGLKPQNKVKPEQQLNVFQQLIQGVRDYDKSNQEMKKQVEKLVNKQMPQAVTAKANLGQLLGGLLGYPGELVAGGGQNMYGGQNTGIMDIPGQIKRMVTNTSTPQEVADFQARLPNVAVQAGVAATGGIKAGEGITRRADRVLGGGTVLDDINALATRPKPAPVNPLQLSSGKTPKGMNFKNIGGAEYGDVKAVVKLTKPGTGKYEIGDVYFWEHPDPNFKQYSKNMIVAGPVKDGKVPTYAFVGKGEPLAAPELTPLSELKTMAPKGVGEIVDPLAKFKKKENLVKIDPVLEIKKQITARDIQGNKVELPAGEALTPYELKGNKYLLKDGNEYIVNKNQYQNIKGNAVKAEAQPFAPELEQTTETVKGKGMWKGDEYIADGRRVADVVKNEDGTWSYRSDLSEGSDTFKTRQEAMDNAVEEITDPYAETGTKFSQYTLPGGENYREVLIQSPTTEKPSIKNMYNKIRKELVFGNKDFEQLSTEELNTLKTYFPNLSNEMGYSNQVFKSSHWDEPNVLAHVRLNDRTYNGKPVTFIEEIQSDWAREARKQGNTGREITQVLNSEGQVVNAFGGAANEVHNAEIQARQIGGTIRKVVPQTPTHPMLKNWQELAAKRALKDAVDNNSEYLAWTTGEQQAARYDLSKQVDEIKWQQRPKNLYPEGGKQIDIYPKDNISGISVQVNNDGIIIGGSDNIPSNWKGKRIEEAVGKGIGERIANESSGNLTGEGLKIGGEWANNLYDRQLPNIIEKLTGQKAEVINLGLPTNARIDKNYFLPDGNVFTRSKIKPGQIFDSSKEMSDNYYMVTKDLGGGKVRAVEALRAENEEPLYQTFKNKDGEFNLEMVKPTASNLKILDKYAETFTIPENETLNQMGIKLTPQVKAKVKGEAPPVKQPSGVNPLLMLMGGLGLTGLMADKKRNQGIMQNYLGL